MNVLGEVGSEHGGPAECMNAKSKGPIYRPTQHPANPLVRSAGSPSGVSNFKYD
jgi:hypothetical protein